MKGFCKCGTIIDEVVYTELGMCQQCYYMEELFKGWKKFKCELEYKKGYKKGYLDAMKEIKECEDEE